MPVLQNLRNACWITRIVLLWLALFLGAAVASPLVRSGDTQMVCSPTGGMKLVDIEQDGDLMIGAGMDCPLCMHWFAPLAEAMATLQPFGLGQALRPPESARLTSLVGPPWLARGPPSASA